ncbi:unnamed protein product [Agarophyton chilense]
MSTAFLTSFFPPIFSTHSRSATLSSCSVVACSIPTTPTPPLTTLGRIFTPFETDTAALSAPIVHHYVSDDTDRFAMWYTYRPKNWQNSSRTPPGTVSGIVALALSEDGITWHRVDGPQNGAVLTNNTDDWWAFDTIHVTVGDVFIDSNSRIRADSGVYFMYYAGGDGEKVSVGETQMQGIRMRIGLAISKDGEHFTRIEGPHPSSAVVDVGNQGDFDSLLVTAPHVTRVEKGYIMHYYTFNEQSKMYMLGRAFSNDGLRFEKKGIALRASGVSGAKDEGGYQRACVVKKGNKYVMFVVMVDGKRTTRIAMCESDDCENWKSAKIVLDVGDKGSWDEKGVSHPYAVVLDDGSALLYYAGKSAVHDINSGNGTSIGVAKSNGTDWERFSRVPSDEAGAGFVQ